MGLKKTHGVSASDFTGIDPCRKQPIYIYIHIHSIPRINLKASIFTRTWILNAIFWVYFSCSHLGLAQSRNFGPWGMIYTALTLWLHLTFECQRWFDDCTYVFLFFPYVPTCSNMFQHVPTCSIWHLHSHALTLKGFTAAESQAPWGQGNVEPSAESRAPGHNVAEWLPAPVPGHLMWMCSMENPKNHMDNLMIFIDDLMGFWMVLDGFDGIWG